MHGTVGPESILGSTLELILWTVMIQMPFNRRMDKENVVHIHNGVLCSRENNDIMKFAGKWMELENVILSE
ncbi:hypothetical protein STEG23_009356, partial [Scotinomys teguina]